MTHTANFSRQGNGSIGKDRPHLRGSGTGLISRFAQRLGLEEGNLRARLERALKGETDEARAFGEQERKWLQNTLHFGALRVEDVMVPRVDIVAIDESAPVGELMRLFKRAGHSRVPVYRDTLDAPQGMLHIKDLMSWIVAESEPAADRKGACQTKGRNDPVGHEQTAMEAAPLHMEAAPLQLSRVDLARPISSLGIIRDVLYVPASMPTVDLLLRMQSTQRHLALVVDEYGGTDGLVTIENLIEEIFGDIGDEHESAGGPLIRETAEGLIAEARTPIDELSEHLGGMELMLPGRDDEVDTLGGLVFALLGRIPLRGELVLHPSGIEFEVLEADPRRIKKLKIHMHEPGATAVSRPAKAAGRSGSA